VSCLVAGREPCVQDGETGDPSIRRSAEDGSSASLVAGAKALAAG
jgi:hypothetical protein